MVPCETYNSLHEISIENLVPKDGRTVTIVSSHNDLISPMNLKKIKLISKAFRKVQLIKVGEFSREEEEVLSIYKTFIIEETNDVFNVFVKCPSFQDFQQVEVWYPGMGFVLNGTILQSRCKSVPKGLPLKAFLIGSSPGLVSKSLINPIGYKVDMYNLAAQKFGFNLIWEVEGSYGRVVRKVSF